VEALKRAKNVVFLLVFILLVFAPIILEFIYLNDFASFLQSVFLYWKNRSNVLLFSDMLFLQGGVLVFLGALVAGVILYNAWGTTKRLFRKYIGSIWNTGVMEKERRSPAGLAVGLILLGAGVAYILVGIAITI
jgi:hypothetical protein